MNRALTVIHADINNFYASVETVYNPSLRAVPMVVGGDPELRHGVVLAKNPIAKKAGIKTGQAIWQARQLCPGLVCVSPDHEKYLDYTRKFVKLLSEYTGQVEMYGPDGAWMDVAGSRAFGDAVEIAGKLRREAGERLGLTLSVGVAANKIFAKLGSDVGKPDSTTVISPENYKQTAWPLSARELIFVGESTQKKLAAYGICTIGDIANANPATLRSILGVNGLMLHEYANGHDDSPVLEKGDGYGIKSISNSTTTPRDLCSMDEAKITTYLLSESVASRLRRHGLKARTVQISLRDNKLVSFTRQTKLPRATQLSGEIARAALRLMEVSHNFETYPVRTLGVCGADLEPAGGDEQLTMFAEDMRREKEYNLERAIDGIRERYGGFSIRRGIMFEDKHMADVVPKAAPLLYPIELKPD